MINSVNYHSVSPNLIIRGKVQWDSISEKIYSICKKPILLGRSKSTREIRENLSKKLTRHGVKNVFAELQNDCCEVDINQVMKIAIENKCDGVIAVGGGKVLDAGKLLAERVMQPCITVPTSAATCAGWTALSNIYSPNGAFIEDIPLKRCPELLIFDHNVVRSAPPKTLASGIGDGLAKWYEASLTSSSSNDGLIQQAVQMARVLRDQLLIDSEEAFVNPYSEKWETIAEGCALTAGLIGGIGGPRCRTAAAHAIHNGITQLIPGDKHLHGEIVSFGILVQLRLEEIVQGNNLASQKRGQLIELFSKLNLPITLRDLGLNSISDIDLKTISDFACGLNSDIHQLPFHVSSQDLLEALIYFKKDLINHERKTDNSMKVN